MEIESESQSAGEVVSQPRSLSWILQNIENNSFRSTRNQQHRRYSVEALVVDATRPYYRPKEKNYAVSVSIIDQTINRIKTPLHPTCSVTLISLNYEGGLFSEIGSVLELHQFSFLANGKQLKAVPYTNSSHRLLGWEEEQQEHRPQRIRHLQRWFLNNLHQLYIPILGVKARSANIVSLAPFSMLLVVSGIDNSETMGLKIYSLTDPLGNVFKFQYEPSRIMRIGSQVVISRITNIDQQIKLQCNELGSMLAMPPGCEVACRPYRILYSEGFKLGLRSEEPASAIKNRLTEITAKASQRYYSQGQLTYLAELLQASTIYRKGGQVELLSSRNYQKHIVEVYPLRIRGAAKLYSRKDRIQCSFDYAFREGMLEFVGPLEYIYEICLEVKDASLANRKDLLKIFIYSWDGQGSQFFPTLDLAKYNLRVPAYKDDPLLAQHDLKQLNQKLQGMFGMLVDRCGPTRRLRLVIEPMKSYRRVEYRIIDTQLSPLLLASNPDRVKQQG